MGRASWRFGIARRRPPSSTLLLDALGTVPPWRVERAQSARRETNRSPRVQGARASARSLGPAGRGATGGGTADVAGGRPERERQSPFLPAPGNHGIRIRLRRTAPDRRVPGRPSLDPIEARPPALRARCGRMVYQYESTVVNTISAHRNDKWAVCRTDDGVDVAQATCLGARKHRDPMDGTRRRRLRGGLMCHAGP